MTTVELFGKKASCVINVLDKESGWLFSIPRERKAYLIHSINLPCCAPAGDVPVKIRKAKPETKQDACNVVNKQLIDDHAPYSSTGKYKIPPPNKGAQALINGLTEGMAEKDITDDNLLKCWFWNRVEQKIDKYRHEAVFSNGDTVLVEIEPAKYNETETRELIIKLDKRNKKRALNARKYGMKGGRPSNDPEDKIEKAIDDVRRMLANVRYGMTMKRACEKAITDNELSIKWQALRKRIINDTKTDKDSM